MVIDVPTVEVPTSAILPDVTVHGVWVRSRVHDGFGRLCWKVIDREYYGQVEFFVLWNGPDEDMGTKGPTGGYHDPENLDVRPYKPKPWLDNPPIEIRYKYWAESAQELIDGRNNGDRNVRTSQEMS